MYGNAYGQHTSVMSGVFTEFIHVFEAHHRKLKGMLPYAVNGVKVASEYKFSVIELD